MQHHIVIMNVVGGQAVRENSLSFHIVPLGRRIQRHNRLSHAQTAKAVHLKHPRWFGGLVV